MKTMDPFQIGGFRSGGVTNELTYLFSGGAESGKWQHLTSVPHIECSNFGCAVVDNEIYVVGGCFNQVAMLGYTVGSFFRKFFVRNIFNVILV